MSDKVMEKIGRQYVKLMAEKLMELEKEQKELAERIAQITGIEIEGSLVKDPEKVIRFLHELAYLIEHYYRLTKELEQFKQHFEAVSKAFGGEVKKDD
jgi:predicted nuclease with TOPRIM domain